MGLQRARSAKRDLFYSMALVSTATLTKRLKLANLAILKTECANSALRASVLKMISVSSAIEQLVKIAMQLQVAATYVSLAFILTTKMVFAFPASLVASSATRMTFAPGATSICTIFSHRKMDNASVIMAGAGTPWTQRTLGSVPAY